MSPQPLSKKELDDLVPVAAGAVTVLRARHVSLDTNADRSPVAAWDLQAVAELYEAFVRQWSGPLPMIDPELPGELMPSGWSRGRAREVFVAVYDGLSRPAEEYVRTVAAEVGDGSHVHIQAHTVAEMRTGIRPELVSTSTSVP